MSPTDVAALAAELRGWLADHAEELAPHRGPLPGEMSERLARGRPLMALLTDGGWVTRGWPEEVGGAGGDIRERGVVYDVLEAEGYAVPEQYAVVETVAPALVRFGPDLAKRHLVPVLRGDETWSQGFSEPEAGSDLASLRCRGTKLDDGSWQVSGQKIWSSLGHLADRMILLVRSGTPESRHRGLTMLFPDLDSPGTEVRPIRLANGEEELAEVFFDDARVPADRLLGEAGGGWGVAMYLLQFERGMYAWLRQAHLRSRLRHLASLADPSDAATSAELGRCLGLQRALRARTWATMGRLQAGDTVGPETSVDKVLLATAEQAVADAIRDTDPTAFLFGAGDPVDGDRAEWFYTRAASIYGGSAEVQRTILADHVLGLPKEAKV